ncbi:uracil-DNA glycosylase [Chlamydia psittaci]|uniref:Uracil-DNA glycosylase n=1 Tax=Chlamydia psittaci 99DC5 TaxID=1112251 RepID=A0ABN0MPD6_CHLPS|nr:uracil-DNA glycosylase [Chlamydia psittaci]AFS20075.1 uracil-DNA glycosylase [Chlamydia psittaci 84/55]AGE75563.1 uracil-DNA glycosylase [Chlamydia psittaci Mat116]EPJ15792.1 uracil-DNA glycosylase [Chlamydia psittaci 02DC18]EPJ17382.1 uracil-DNA glycosylase [Chlamydia psittaci 02DC22]EPJ19652.1 uracil-DNA glycosylase [Chlamydia psittaci 02DC23]EPJ20757.1 uracil-DNA glycosylase [Chlamydia psittaci 02DC21]EPJ25082.1 uracil-DNA glycosylase [Chlamydia psittaci 03DC29]EPJ25309.1 uracil-DNA g
MQNAFTIDQLPLSWQEQLENEWSQPYMYKLREFLQSEYSQKTIYPAKDNIFTALKSTPFDSVRVVILGQDPYPGEGQAHGLSFSVPQGVRLPPSLVNIFKELHTDLGVQNTTGCLQAWANQGILLLNTVLTVRAGSPFSHAGRGWEQFTDAIVTKLIENRSHVIFVLWGNAARKKCDLLFRSTHKHAILASAHPSPLSAHRGFFGCSHFSKINYLLKKLNKPMINWKLP